MPWRGIISGIAAYLLGSIPFGYLLVRLRRGEDIRKLGSGNIGATNVLRSQGRIAGLATLLLDVGKGYIAVAVAEALVGNSPAWISFAALAAIAGHVFSIFLKFRGGKGVATALGAFLPIAPLAVFAAGAVFLIVLGAWRYVSLASVVAVGGFPVALLLLGGGPSRQVLFHAAMAAALIVARHGSNLRRLRAGTEARI